MRIAHFSDHRQMLMRQEQIDLVAVAVQDIRSGVADLVIAVNEADTHDDVMRLRKLASDLAVELLTVESIALDRAGRLCGQRKD